MPTEAQNENDYNSAPYVEGHYSPAIGQTISPAEVREYIAEKAKEKGISVELALELARIESQFNPYARNPKSTAKGVYQWLDGSWALYCEGDVFDYRDNVDCAIEMIARGGLYHWTADKNIKIKLTSANLK